MIPVGSPERPIQNRVVALFCDTLDYQYLGNWIDRPYNRNIEDSYLRAFLKEKQGYEDSLINRALHELDRVAGDQSRNLYDINKDVYGLLRYGVKIRVGAGDQTQTVW